MKVLLVSLPEPEGHHVFCFVDSLAHFLADHGIELHLAYAEHQRSDRLQALVDFIRTQGGKPIDLSVNGRLSLSDVRGLRALRAFVKEIRPNIIHSHGAKAGLFARMLAPLGIETPQVYQPHAYVGMHSHGSFTRILYDGVESLLGRWSTTINTSHEEHDYALARLHLPPPRTVNVTNGIDTGHFHQVSAAEKTVLRRRLGLPARNRILGTLDRPSNQQDLFTTYEAFTTALVRDPDLLLLHVGRGEFDAKLERFIARRWLVGRIIRLPHIPDAVEFYQVIDGLILSSQYSGMSRAVREAMSCNLPLILSDVPAHRELMKLSLTHLWSVPAGDVAGFARAIHAWSSNAPPLCNHRACAVQNFDSRDTYSNILALYRRLQRVPWVDNTPAPDLTSGPSEPKQALG